MMSTATPDRPPRVRVVCDVEPYLAAMRRAIEATLREVAREDGADDGLV